MSSFADPRHGAARDRVALLAAVSVLAGLLVAGVALPVVGGLGLITERGIEKFEQLPSELKQPPLPERTRILAADGSVIATFYYENRISVPLTEIAPVMRQAIVAIEDSRFYQHGGIDTKGVLRALLNNSRAGSVRQGGSTITQQYVKNALIEAAATEEDVDKAHEATLARKVREARYAMALEHQLSKDEILERYLNIALFGGGAYGVEAAARRFFDKHANELTLPDAALLAGMVRNPSAYDPLRHPQTATARRDTVLTRMHELGYITDAEYAKATKAKLGLHPTQSSNSCQDSSAPFFCDYVKKRFLDTSTLGRTRDDRIKLLLRGGLDIRTTLQTRAQRSAQRAVESRVPKSSPFASAIAMIEPGTGKVRAIAQNRDFGEEAENAKKSGARRTSVNYATDLAYGGSRGFPSGSTMKVFTLASAIDQGIPLSTRINAPNRIDYGTLAPRDCNGRPRVDPGRYAYNAESEGGSYDLRTGTWKSVNTFFLLLEKMTGICKPVRLAQQLGVRRADGTALGQNPSFTLGVDFISPLAMAGAYATFAARGKFCPPTVITSVTDSEGKSLELPPTDCRQVLDAGVADTVTSVLEGVIKYGTGRGLDIGRPAAGKTGTVTGFYGAWFCGYTPQLAAATFVADPVTDPSQQRRSLRGVNIGGRYYSEVFGATIPGPIWQQAMIGALKGKRVIDFPPADSTVSAGRYLTVPDVRGLSPAVATQQLDDAGLNAVVSETRVSAGGRAGTVGYTSPGTGARVIAGTVVTIYITNGSAPPPSPAPRPSTSATPGTTPPAEPKPTKKPHKTPPPQG